MGLDEQYAEAEQWVAHSMQLHQVHCDSKESPPVSHGSAQTMTRGIRQRHTGIRILVLSRCSPSSLPSCAIAHFPVGLTSTLLLYTCCSESLQNVTVNLFETTIRVLGGLQSAFVLSGGNKVFLWQALDLGLRLSVRRFVFLVPA